MEPLTKGDDSMITREILEKREEDTLTHFAMLSSKSKGRQSEEEPCDFRTDFQRDRDRIIHCKAFRRLKHKTQVFIAPEGDHYRTRLTHTLEVSQIARTISRALGLNEDLTEAIALGHDLGHTPFGHGGEEVLNRLSPRGFKHNVQSLRVVDVLEKIKGLNLTSEVRDGILCHTGLQKSLTLEGQVVALADRVAYINHDIDDALRAGVLKMEALPKDSIELFGTTPSERINVMVRDIIINCWHKSSIQMSEEKQLGMENLRSFLFEKVYIGSEAKEEEYKAKQLLEMLYHYFCDHPEKIIEAYKKRADDTEEAVVDYIAGMTDHYVMHLYSEIFIPHGWKV